MRVAEIIAEIDSGIGEWDETRYGCDCCHAWVLARVRTADGRERVVRAVHYLANGRCVNAECVDEETNETAGGAVVARWLNDLLSEYRAAKRGEV